MPISTENDTSIPLKERMDKLTVKFATREEDWGALDFQTKVSPNYRRAQIRYLGGGGTGAHDPRLRAPPEQEVQRVREDGLARTGLAGEHVEPDREAQLGPLDKQEVLDAEFGEHA